MEREGGYKQAILDSYPGSVFDITKFGMVFCKSFPLSLFISVVVCSLYWGDYESEIRI